MLWEAPPPAAGWLAGGWTGAAVVGTTAALFTAGVGFNKIHTLIPRKETII